MDLHTQHHPPPEPEVRTSSVPIPTSHSGVTTAIDISPNVKNHLYSIFFEHVQPPFPVVSRASLQRFPSTPLLEATILGTAARHHDAIASWRDLAHLKQIIKSEVKDAVGFREPYQPKIQTLQAFLLLSMTSELATQGHSDVMSIPLRLGILCQMARDIGIDKELSSHTEDKALFAILWKACLFQDAFLCAIFGQPLNISITPQVSLDLCSSIAGNVNEAYFLAATEASHCLRHLLRTLYVTSGPSEQDTVTRSYQALEQIHLYERALEARRQEFTDFQYRALRIFHHNNRLLFVLGLSVLTTEFHKNPEITNLLSHEAGLIIPEACQTLLWFSVDFLQSMPCRLDHLLYCETRAAMLIVDVLLEIRRTQPLASEIAENLQNAIAVTQTLKDFLIQQNSWGSYWTQGHTLEAVLARLEDAADQSTLPMSSELKNVIGLQPASIPATDIAFAPTMSTDADYGYLYYEELLNNVLYNSTDWNMVLNEYSEDCTWPVW